MYAYRHFLVPLQQMTIENIVEKGEIAHDEQFLLLRQYFQLFSTNKLSLTEIFCNYATMFSKSSAADLLYVGKG